MKLFYGADKLIRSPRHGLGNPTNDYGLGLYLTPDFGMAELWASKFPNGGYAMAFDVDLSGLNILRLDDATDEAVLRWITILVQFRFDKLAKVEFKDRIEELRRRFYVDVNAYDVIIGYRADDSYFNYARGFLANTLSLEVLGEAMKLGKLGTQVVLKSPKAFEHIRFVESKPIPHSTMYEQFRRLTLDQFHILKTTDKDTNTFIRDILRRN